MTAKQVQRARAAQLLGVLALLLGLLAMRGLVSGHHAPLAAASAAVGDQAGSLHTVSAAASGHAHEAVHDAATHAGAAGALALPGLRTLDGLCPDCDEHCVAMLCLAVPSAGLALLIGHLARRARTQGLPAPRLALPLLRAGPLVRLRPPDLVAQLCVSRT